MGAYSNDDGKRLSSVLSLQETSRLETDFAVVEMEFACQGLPIGGAVGVGVSASSSQLSQS